MRHVRSHVRIPGNELADRLAEARGQGDWKKGQTVTTAVKWMETWITDRYDDG